MFTDTEVIMTERFRADLRGYAQSAQTIIDHKDVEMRAALQRIQELENELSIEKARRQSVEIKLDRMRRR